MGGRFKQAERLPTDGAVHITRMGDDHMAIAVTTDGREESIVCSLHNAARTFGMLALMLGISLPAATGKAIKL